MILPVTMGMVSWIAWHSRFLRSSMLDVIHQDYIRTARAKGLSERLVLYRHAFKNAAIPLVTMLALDLPVTFSGIMILVAIISVNYIGDGL
jgi:peptide/nickel transport system permease protein